MYECVYAHQSRTHAHTHTHTHTHTVEIATLTRQSVEGTPEKTQIRVLPAEETDAIIKEFYDAEEARKKEEKAKEEKAKQEKAAASKDS